MGDDRHTLDANPDGGLQTLPDLKRPTAVSDSSMTAMPWLIGDASRFRLERLLAQRHEIHGAPVPFVGRREELERAYNAVRAAVNHKRLHVIGLVGSAGVGKTRLLAEMFAIVDPLARGIEVFAASCSEAEPADGILVVSQLLRGRFDIDMRASDEDARRRIRRALEPLVKGPGLDTAARQLGYLVGLRAVGPAAEEEASPRELVRFQRHAIRTFYNLMRYHAERMPQVLVVHRSRFLTPRTITVLEGLCEELADTPTTLFVVGDRRPPQALVEVAPAFEEITLGPLSTRDADRLLRGVLSRMATVPQELVDVLMSRAHGQPRLLEDEIRYLIDRKVLEVGEETWTFHPDRMAGGVEIPSTAEAAARARVAGLAPELHHVLAMGAVFGLTFWQEALLAMLRVRPTREQRASVPWFDDEPARALAALLDGAVADELLQEQEHPALPGKRELTFARGEDRAALYDGLDPGTRALYHRLAAQWLGSLELEDRGAWAVALGEHLELGGRPERAAAWFLEGAAAARARYDVAAARDQYRRALANVDLDRIDLLVPILRGLGELLFATGEFHQARRVFSALLEASLIARDRATGARAWLMMGQTHRLLGDIQRALLAFQYAEKLFQGEGDEAGLASVLEQVAKVVWMEGAEGAYEDALRHFGKALELRRRLGRPRDVASSLVSIANVHLQRGDPAKAERGFIEAIARFREAGDPAGEATALVGLGAVHHANGEAPRALDAWEAGLEIAEQHGDRELIGILMNNLGEVHLEEGRLEKAGAALERARRVTLETGDQRTAADVHRNLGALAIQRGDWQEALRWVEEAIATARALGLRPLLGNALRTKGEILGRELYADASKNDVLGREGARCFEDAIDLFEDMGDALEQKRTLKAYAQFLFERGQDAKGKALLQRADSLTG